MTNKKISLVLPTYNVARYLEQCLQSILESTYKNYEVIIVIDGATDGSYEIAQKYSEKYENFYVYWQENAGSGPARNLGLKNATGELIMFIDPDDWIEPDYIEKMVVAQQENDYDLLVASSTYHIFNKKESKSKIIKKNVTPLCAPNKMDARTKYASLLYMGRLSGPHCKIFKQSIIKRYGIEFPDLRRSQDIVFNYRYYNYIESVYVVEEYGYNYRCPFDNHKKKLSIDYWKTLVFIYEDIKKLIISWGVNDEDGLIPGFILNHFYAYLEKCVWSGVEINSVIPNESIQEMAKNAYVKKRHVAVVQKMIRKKHFFRLKIFLYIMVVMKSFIRG